MLKLVLTVYESLRCGLSISNDLRQWLGLQMKAVYRRIQQPDSAPITYVSSEFYIPTAAAQHSVT